VRQLLTASVLYDGRGIQYKYSIIKFQISIMVTTPAIESANACLASLLPSNLSAFATILPRDELSFMVATSRLDQQFSVLQSATA
jgi:hypothetical protein